MWSRVGYFSQSRPKTKELKLGKQKAFGPFCTTSHTSHTNTVLPELAAAASIAARINHERKTHCQPASGCVWGLGLKQCLCLDLSHLSARSFFFQGWPSFEVLLLEKGWGMLWSLHIAVLDVLDNAILERWMIIIVDVGECSSASPQFKQFLSTQAGMNSVVLRQLCTSGWCAVAGW